jgi:CBS domain-containing protein
MAATSKRSEEHMTTLDATAVRVADVMTPRPIVATPHMTVRTARLLMEQQGVRHLPVTAGATLAGIVSRRDLGWDHPSAPAPASPLQGDLLDGRYRTLATIMSAPVHVIDPEASLADAARRLVALDIGALPVVAGGLLVGIVTRSDCLLRLAAAVDQPAGPQP